MGSASSSLTGKKMGVNMPVPMPRRRANGMTESVRNIIPPKRGTWLRSPASRDAKLGHSGVLGFPVRSVCIASLHIRRGAWNMQRYLSRRVASRRDATSDLHPIFGVAIALDADPKIGFACIEAADTHSMYYRSSRIVFVFRFGVCWLTLVGVGSDWF